MNHPEAIRQDKAKQIWEIDINRKQTIELIKHSATNCLL
jgi:hypothetical protein